MKDRLIVEDIPSAADYLGQVLDETFPLGANRVAANLQDAMQQIANKVPDLILLDIGLPDGSGLDILKIPAAQQSCVIITTIFDDDQHLFSALRLGAQGYLLKDETKPQLIAALQGIAKGQPPLSASMAQKVMHSFRPNQHIEQLTPREEEILLLVAKGYTNRETADALSLTPNTIAGYIKSIYQKLEINSRAEATAQAIKMGVYRQ